LKQDSNVCCSIAVIRNSSTHILQNRRRFDGERSTRITCSTARSKCRPGGEALWCGGSWDRTDLRKKRRSGLLRQRNNFSSGRIIWKGTASILICISTSDTGGLICNVLLLFLTLCFSYFCFLCIYRMKSRNIIIFSFSFFNSMQ